LILVSALDPHVITRALWPDMVVHGLYQGRYEKCHAITYTYLSEEIF
jgi:hypothetical protein